MNGHIWVLASPSTRTSSTGGRGAKREREEEEKGAGRERMGEMGMNVAVSYDGIRKGLAALYDGRVHSFTGIFDKLSTTISGKPVALITDLESDDGVKCGDHLWIPLNKKKRATLRARKYGSKIRVRGVITRYIREDGSQDYGLSVTGIGGGPIWFIQIKPCIAG